MARGRSSSSSSRGSSFGSRSSSRSASPPPRQQPHTTTQTQPMQQQSSGGMMSGLGSTLMTGMAFGAGSEVAHQAVRGLMGGGSHGNNQVQQSQPQEQTQNYSNNQTQQQQNNCVEFNTRFVDCLKRENNDISSCQSLFDDLKSCEKNLFR